MWYWYQNWYLYHTKPFSFFSWPLVVPNALSCFFKWFFGLERGPPWCLKTTAIPGSYPQLPSTPYLKNTLFVQYQYNQATISLYPFIYTIVGLSIVSTRLILVTCFRCEWNLMQLNSRVSVCDAFYKLLQKKGGRLVFSIETQWDMELRFETCCWKWKDFAVPYAWCRRHIGPPHN